MLRNLFRKKKEDEDEIKEVKEETQSEEPQKEEDLESTESPADKDSFWGKKDGEDEETLEDSSNKTSWFNRLKKGLSKTRKNVFSQITSLIRLNRKIDDELLEEIEEILIQTDVGVNTTMKLIDSIRETVKERGLEDSSELEGILKDKILEILGEDKPIDVNTQSPFSFMVLGVNGVGKTTTIGKLANRYKSEGKRVLVAAGDTFRAAGTEQLDIWCNRAGVEMIKGKRGQDPASVIYDAMHASISRKADVLIADTAGRLHTKKPLMDELAKIGRVMKRELPGAPNEVLLVLDATTGQNAIMQAKMFNQAVPVTGIALTKLDGTAKGGIVIAVRDELGIPIKLIGIGEKIDDLRDFSAQDFVDALFAEDERLS